MVEKAEKSRGSGEAAMAAEAAAPHYRRRSFNKPSWLLCTIADMDERMKALPTKENSCDSFAGRANSYYDERPQLLALLHELYNGYLSLADRYCQALAKNSQLEHHHNNRNCCVSAVLFSKFDDNSQIDEVAADIIDSDAESSLSFQPPALPHLQSKEVDAEMVIAELVMKKVECDIVMNEAAVVKKMWSESSKKMELQKNLLDVLDSERMILLNDNATLGYRVNALMEENKGLASESLFLKRKAAELARCVLKTTEDHRVCALSGKIEDLQRQIHGLEKQNKEYYEQLMMQEEEKSKCKETKGYKGGEEVCLEDCLQGHGAGAVMKKCFSCNGTNGEDEGKRPSKLWDKIKKFDLFLCVPHFRTNGV